MPTFVANSPVDMNEFMATGGLFDLYGTGTVVTNDSTTFQIEHAFLGELTLSGSLGYDSGLYPSSGTITGLDYSITDGPAFTVTDIWMPVWQFQEYSTTNDLTALFADLLAGDDSLTGSNGNDWLLGFGGNDMLNGGVGNDVLNGGPGDDAMTGGPGDDIFHVDSPFDTIFENPGEGIDTILTAVNFVLWEDFENGVLTEFGDLSLIGNALGNVLIGNSGNNVLDGWHGNDFVYGRDGNDTLYGWTGNDFLDGGPGNDHFFGEYGIDFLTGGPGADIFEGTLLGLNGDTISDFTIDDSIIFSDAELGSFDFLFTGSTLSYTGGSLTLGGSIGVLTAQTGPSGGVLLTMSDAPPPPPPSPAPPRSRLLLTETGQDFDIGGNVAVFGTSGGGEEIRIIFGDVLLDASFNIGGDTVVLDGPASIFTATLSGSFVTLVGDDLSVTIPVGTAGLTVEFDDAERTLLFDPATGQVMLGDQPITTTTSNVEAAYLPFQFDGNDTGPPSLGKLLLTLPGQDIDIGGNVNIVGTTAPGEVITIVSDGTVVLDASFNTGGDTVAFQGETSSFTATLSGSFVTIEGLGNSVSIPVGVVGLTVDFFDSSRILRFDTTSGQVLLGDQVITSSTQPVTPPPSAEPLPVGEDSSGKDGAIAYLMHLDTPITYDFA